METELNVLKAAYAGLKVLVSTQQQLNNKQIIAPLQASLNNPAIPATISAAFRPG